MPHPLWGMGKERLEPPVRVGPPKGLAVPRVSATRQGVTGTNHEPVVCAGATLAPAIPAQHTIRR